MQFIVINEYTKLCAYVSYLIMCIRAYLPLCLYFLRALCAFIFVRALRTFLFLLVLRAFIFLLIFVRLF